MRISKKNFGVSSLIHCLQGCTKTQIHVDLKYKSRKPQARKHEGSLKRISQYNGLYAAFISIDKDHQQV